MYMDEKVNKRPAKYRKLAGRKKFLKKCYCITLPANRSNMMDIYPSGELWLKYNAAQGTEVIGIASCEENVVQLVAEIVQDIYKKYGDISPELLREFFSNSSSNARKTGIDNR